MIHAHDRSNSVALLHYTAPPVVGGVESVVQAHARLLCAHHIPVTVVAGRGDAAMLPEGTAFICIPEMDSRYPAVLELNTALLKGSVPPAFERWTEQLLALLGPVLAGIQTVIVHNVFTKHFNLALTAALLRLVEAGTIQNCVAWCHDFSWKSPNSLKQIHPGYPWDLMHTYYPRLTYVTISEERKNILVDLLGCPSDKVQVIYNGVDPVHLLGLSGAGIRLVEQFGLLESELNLLMPVRVTRAKNIELALEIAAAICGRGVDLRMVLTGPPDPHDPASLAYFRSLQQRRDELGLKKNMHFVYENCETTGQPLLIDEMTVADLLRVSDMMLMTSHHEGFGMPVLEAGLLGIAVASTHVPAALEIASGNTCLFDKQDDPQRIADMLLNWIQSNPQQRLRQLVRTEYRWEEIFRRKIRPLLEQP
jgi:glycosyltransferase involved in cell wall biosynthesis